MNGSDLIEWLKRYNATKPVVVIVENKETGKHEEYEIHSVYEDECTNSIELWTL